MADGIGKLALADAALGFVTTEILVLWDRSRNGGDGSSYAGLSSGQAAHRLREVVKAHPSAFDPATDQWIDRCMSAVNDRNLIFHARAADECISCGATTRYTGHLKQGTIDRSPARVAKVAARLRKLADEGMTMGKAAATLVNNQLVEDARAEVKRTRASSSPPQYTFTFPIHRCGGCTGTGVGEISLAVGTAVAVLNDSDRAAIIEAISSDETAGPK